MSRSHVLVTRRLPGEAVEQLRRRAEVEVWSGELPPRPAELRTLLQPADAVVALLTESFDAELLATVPRLRAICNVAVGYDNVDLDAATRAGVYVTNTPGVLTETTADFAFALLLAAARRVTEADRFTRAGRWRTWDPALLLGSDIHGATLGIVGLGAIGAAVARRARGFDMRLLYAGSPKPALEAELGIQRLDLDSLLRAADFVSLHVPLTPATQQLIGARELALMKPSAVLINTARGPVIDQQALVAALRGGCPAAAALDVTDPEPIGADDPLLALDNVVLAPHIGSASLATRSRMADMAATNALAAIAGELPPNCVNPEAVLAHKRCS